jgi:hypothetical protein
MWPLILKTNLRKAWEKVLEEVFRANQDHNRRDHGRRREKRREKKRQKNCYNLTASSGLNLGTAP